MLGQYLPKGAFNASLIKIEIATLLATLRSGQTHFLSATGTLLLDERLLEKDQAK